MMTEETVFIVDDDQEARYSVCALAKSMNWRCQSFASAEEFLAAYDPTRHGCLVADLRMVGMSGLELQSEMKRRGWTLPLVLVSGYLNVPNTVQAMKEGAEHVLTKPYQEQELCEAIEAALKHDRQLRQERAQRDDLVGRFGKLTPDERQVLDLIATGLPNKAVARQLDIGLRTVEDRRRRIMEKVGADSFAVLMAMYSQLQAIVAPSEGLLDAGDQTVG
jgi:two-component system, LuxR family, response regulator FixJ